MASEEDVQFGHLIGSGPRGGGGGEGDKWTLGVDTLLVHVIYDKEPFQLGIVGSNAEAGPRI